MLCSSASESVTGTGTLLATAQQTQLVFTSRQKEKKREKKREHEMELWGLVIAHNQITNESRTSNLDQLRFLNLSSVFLLSFFCLSSLLLFV